MVSTLFDLLGAYGFQAIALGFFVYLIIYNNIFSKKIDKLEIDLKAGINKLDIKIEDVRTELKADINEVRTELKADISEIKTSINRLEQKVEKNNDKIGALSERLARQEATEIERLFKRAKDIINVEKEAV
jgi:septal ring factor EnvC (AmiA/AmiB activator)